MVKTQALPFDLYYHEDSLAEMQNTVVAVQQRLERVNWPSALSRAVLHTRAQDLSGIDLKFHQANSQDQIDPATFLMKYRHVEKLLNSEGFKIYRRPDRRNTEAMDKKTAELASQYKRFLEDRLPVHKQRPLRAIKHDMVVWQAAKDLRRAGGTGLDVGALFLSADQRLFAFDWGVLREGHGLGVVVLPSQLLQLLRPFVPRTTDFDKKFAEIFSMPEFRSAHSDFSRIVQRVLQFLASVKGITEETASAILADELLLRRLMKLDADDEIKTVIESEVLKRNDALLAELKETRASADARKMELEEREQQLVECEQALRKQAEALDHERSEKAKSQQAASGLAQQTNQIQIQLNTVSVEKQQVESDLADTKRNLKTLETRLATIESSRSRKVKAARSAAFLIFSVLGWATLMWLPQIKNWEWLQGHEHKLGLYLAAIILVPAISWSIFGWKRRGWALVVIGLAVIMQLIQVL